MTKISFGIIFLCILFVVANIGSAQNTTKKADAVVKAIENNYTEFLDNRTLSIDYSMTNEHVQGENNFAFTKSRIAYHRDANKLRVSIVGYGKDAKNPLVDRRITWNGKAGMSIVDNSNHIFIGIKPDNLLYIYQYYINYLCYPLGEAKLGGSLTSEVVEKSNYWLPNAVLEYRSKYRLRSNLELVDGQACHVLERPGIDIIWVDMANEGTILKRAYYAKENLLKEVTFYSNYAKIGKLKLPMNIKKDFYGRASGERKFHNKICETRRIEVTNASIQSIDKDMFVLPVAVGNTVHDQIRGVQYVVQSDSNNPFAKTLVDARRILSQGKLEKNRSSYSNIWLVLNTLVVLVLLTLLSIRMVKNNSS